MNISVKNIKTEGNKIIITTNPISKIKGINGFTEILTGITPTDYFLSKQFRYTTNGVTYSEPQDFTQVNLQALLFDPNDTVVLEITYVRTPPPLDQTIVSYYVGWLISQALPVSPTSLQKSGEVIHDQPFYGDFTENNVYRYLVAAEPATEEIKTKWYSSLYNQGDIDIVAGGSSLFYAIVKNGYRYYVSNYPTYNTQEQIQFLTAESLPDISNLLGVYEIILDVNDDSFTYYWGWGDLKSAPLDVTTLQRSGYILHGDPLYCDYRVNKESKYLYAAEPVTEPVKITWYGSYINQGAIDHAVNDNDLFFYVEQGGWRIYITNYLTFQTDTPLLLLTTPMIDGVDSTNYYFDNSIFTEFFSPDDQEVLGWYLNVTNKMFTPGVLASYIERYDDNASPDQFIDFWKVIAKYFSYLVIYSRKYQNFHEEPLLLQEFLEERGLKTSINNTLTELKYLMETYNKQIFNRGTNHITDNKQIKDVQVNGELLRLLHFLNEDEFLFNLHKTENFGWNLNNSSPLWKGVWLSESLNKINPWDSNEFIKVSDRLNYGVSFSLKTAGVVKVTIEGYDKDSQIIPLRSHADNSQTNVAINDLTLMRPDEDIFVKIFLYNKDKDFYIYDTTNLNYGNNLILQEGVTYIKVIVQIDGVQQTLTDLKVVPMFTNFSHGLVQFYNFISAWLSNNNSQYDMRGIKSYIREYLIPFDSHIEIMDVLNDATYNDKEQPVIPPVKRTGWRPVNPSCSYAPVTGTTTTSSTTTTTTKGPNFIWIGEESTSYCL